MTDDALLWSRGALRCLDHCPACSAPARESAVWSRRDDSGLMPDVWHIHRCSSCKSIYLDPRPDARSLAAAYSDYLTHDIADDEKIFTSHSWQCALIRDYLKWRLGLRIQLRTIFGGRWLFTLIEPWRLKLDRFGRNLTKSRFAKAGRVLDVGCGAGDFLRLAGMMGWEAHGCDPDSTVVELCQSRGLNVRVGGIESFVDNDRKYDAITLNQVIEHVIDPQSILKNCYDLLEPGGMLWLGFPNPEALGCSVFGEAWAGLHPPYHLLLPTQSVMKRWLITAGFEQVSFRRRGSHARANWRKSVELARSMNIAPPSEIILKLSELLDNTLSTLSPRWGEETVVIARKAGRKKM